MYLKHLYLTNFKNYAGLELDFCPRINCFTGNNGSGKTNLLDAIHYLSFSKSYFGAGDRENIRHGEDFFALNGLYSLDGSDAQVNIVVKKGQKKSLKFNQKECERMSQHLGRIPLIMVSPQDQEMVYGGLRCPALPIRPPAVRGKTEIHRFVHSRLPSVLPADCR